MTYVEKKRILMHKEGRRGPSISGVPIPTTPNTRRVRSVTDRVSP